MADFYLILNRTIGALPENTGTARRSVYERARGALVRQLEALDPPLSPEELSRQRLELEEAIRKVEAEYGTAMYAGSKPAEAEDKNAPSEAGQKTPETGPDSQDPEAKIEQAKTILKDAVRDAEQLGTRAPDQPAAKPAEKPAPEMAKPAVEPKRDAKPDPVLAADRLTAQASAQKSGSPIFLILGLLGLIIVGAVAAFTQKDAIVEALFGAETTSTPVVASNETDTPPETVPEQAEERDPPKNVRNVDEERVPEDDDAAPDSAQTQSSGTTTTIAKSDDSRDQSTDPDTGVSQPEASSQGNDVGQTGSGATTDPAGTPDANAPLISDRAILYEEGNQSGQTAQALSASVAWELVPGIAGGVPSILARVSVPDRGLTLELVIRKNDDQALPASHMVELTFSSPADFPGGAIEKVPGMIMKTAEQARGRALSAASAKVSENFFWLALSSIPGDQQVNEDLLRTQNWIDIPLLYTNKRRAILTLEKGSSGKRVFDDALRAWGG
ncbi:hypothetical protein [Coralliovum pocilloporae]|uniref:hypothetical protein n=1 Tax=Coralliovum pocilloporae TaxID=3066369 RepID=UPI003307A1EA